MSEYGYQEACERIAEIAGDAIVGKMDADAALVAISTIASSAPKDPGEAWFTDRAASLTSPGE